jgi:hypothetical protein
MGKTMATTCHDCLRMNDWFFMRRYQEVCILLFLTQHACCLIYVAVSVQNKVRSC